MPVVRLLRGARSGPKLRARRRVASMIALDANGADRGPATVAAGGRSSGVPVLLFGPAAELGDGADVVDAPLAVTNEDEPARAVRASPDASIVRAAKAVA